ncbi:MAG: 2Fe-2S iron-sulfur cluster binding domain-containing protein [Alphaproteobacteria bacterium]|nr:2Fe-2S iron-sulfur cluster binding domain-containing protein [Alphaproteobacteria bacterium]
MPTIHFINLENKIITVSVPVGTNIKDAALDHGIDGIFGECGGSCTCATCHIYIEAEWFDRVGGADDFEQDMLEFAPEVTLHSRLSCQIKVTDALDGIKVKIPTRQY